MKAAVIQFPGSNCDRDMAVALEQTGADVSIVWHKDAELPQGVDLVAIPGGFSFGDMECTDDTIDEFNKLLHWKESYQSTNSVNLCGHDTILSVLKLLFDCLNCCTVKEHQKYFNWQWILSILLSYLHLAGKMDYSLDCCSHLK